MHCANSEVPKKPMARKHNKNRGSEVTKTTTIPLAKLRPAPLVSPSNRNLITALEDRREYHPLKTHRPPASLSSGSRILVVPKLIKSRKPNAIPTALGFKAPKEVSLCVRRHQRREVLFAMRRTGKGSRSPKHRNKWSDIKC